MDHLKTVEKSQNDIENKCVSTGQMPEAYETLDALRKAFYSPAPYSDDPIAVARREACDYSQRITREMAMSGKGQSLTMLCSLPCVFHVTD